MLESLEKDQLYTALAQAQSEFPIIGTNRQAHKNKYADLYAILHKVYPILKKYGLSVKPWGGLVDGVQCIGARLSHKSGQFETNVFLFEQDECKNPNDQRSHKKQGAFTYFNRNHVKDMLGVLITDDPDDDDLQFVPATENQINTITKMAINRNVELSDVLEFYGLSDVSQLSSAKASEIIKSN